MTRQRKPLKTNELKTIKELYDYGYSYSEIAEAVGRPQGTIGGIIKRYGWERNLFLAKMKRREKELSDENYKIN
jgi:IS30 family transposase